MKSGEKEQNIAEFISQRWAEPTLQQFYRTQPQVNSSDNLPISFIPVFIGDNEHLQHYLCNCWVYVDDFTLHNSQSTYTKDS
jgi:hypothetical protein